MKPFLSIGLLCSLISHICAQEIMLRSPSDLVQVTISLNDGVQYSVQFNGQPVIAPSSVSMTLQDDIVLGLKPKLLSQKTRAVDQELKPLFHISDTINDHYNELVLRFRGNYSILFRAYDNGVAYRFETRFKEDIFVFDEESNFNFTDDHLIFWPEADSLMSSFESTYPALPLSEINAGKMAFSPILIDMGTSKCAILEADLMDYPGMFIRKSMGKAFQFQGKFAAYPKTEQLSGSRDHIVYVTGRETYLAHTKGTRSFPWRIIALANKETELLSNTLVYQLATPSENRDWSWVKPGKVAWDWWSNINLKGVDFVSGMNTATFKYFIDFAADNHIEYVNIDAGWSDLYHLSQINPAINMDEVAAYAQKKGVGLFLWCAWYALEKEWESAFNQFEQWGIAGLKIDYMNRDDQKVVQFYENVLKEAAERKMSVNFHGAFKSTGLYRTYPNLLNREGVLGLEHNKWSENVTPRHDVTVPYIRMLAGPMDYTPGAMLNRSKENFSIIRNHPMSQGTRCHQMAMYVVYFAPLQMLADAPTNYVEYPDLLQFLGEVPTTWNETLPIAGTVGEYVVMARRKGNDWYIGGMTNWKSREITVDLSFLGQGTYNMLLFKDGPNAHKHAEDHTSEETRVAQNDQLSIVMKNGGGFVAKLSPAK